MLLTKKCVVFEPRKNLLTVSIHCSIALCKYVVVCLAAAVYNGLLLRLCLPVALESFHKLVLLKLE